MILLTQCYYHRGPLVVATYDPTGMLRKSTCVRIFSIKTYSRTQVQRQRQTVVRNVAAVSGLLKPKKP